MNKEQPKRETLMWADELRKACNHLTPEQREKLMEAAEKIMAQRTDLFRQLAKE